MTVAIGVGIVLAHSAGAFSVSISVSRPKEVFPYGLADEAGINFSAQSARSKGQSHTDQGMPGEQGRPNQHELCGFLERAMGIEPNAGSRIGRSKWPPIIATSSSKSC
jgi:hypothetical protein